ncbi:hypothetical protein V8E36_005632 [Tilletia maclaganii]
MSFNIGPSAPPQPSRRANRATCTSIRRLFYYRAGIGPGSKARIWELPVPRNNHEWPVHPLDYQREDGIEPWTSRVGPNGVAEEHVKMFRGDLTQSIYSNFNAPQVFPICRYAMANKAAFGMRDDMTWEQLMALINKIWKGWQRQHKTHKPKREEVNKRAAIASRQARKGLVRWVALGLSSFCHFANGSKLPRPKDPSDSVKVRGTATLADLEFATLNLVQSPEEIEYEQRDDGIRIQCRRRYGLSFRSAELVAALEKGDLNRESQPTKPILPPVEYFSLPSDFTLPSTVRRWMVSKTFADAHPHACRRVSDNAGPYVGPFAVAHGPLEWGTPYQGLPDADEDDDDDVPIAALAATALVASS